MFDSTEPYKTHYGKTCESRTAEELVLQLDLLTFYIGFFYHSLIKQILFFFTEDPAISARNNGEAVADKGDEQSYIKSWMWLMLLSVRIDNRIYGPRYITFPPKQYTTTSLTTSYEFCSLSKTQLMHITGAYPEMFLMEASY